jgi:GNAT superfamily N-acetyltransferase
VPRVEFTAGPVTPRGQGGFPVGELQRKPVVVRVAELAGVVLGDTYAGLEGNDDMVLRGPEGGLYDLVVEPARRREGIGRLLLGDRLTTEVKGDGDCQERSHSAGGEDRLDPRP